MKSEPLFAWWQELDIKTKRTETLRNTVTVTMGGMTDDLTITKQKSTGEIHTRVIRVMKTHEDTADTHEPNDATGK